MCTEQVLSRNILDGNSVSHSVLLVPHELISGSVHASLFYLNSYVFLYMLEEHNYS